MPNVPSTSAIDRFAAQGVVVLPAERIGSLLQRIRTETLVFAVTVTPYPADGRYYVVTLDRWADVYGGRHQWNEALREYDDVAPGTPVHGGFDRSAKLR